MKVLSLRQPWAWLVVHGGKTIENRKWNTKFRGEFLIHVSKGMTRSEYADAVQWTIVRGHAIANFIPAMDDLDRGGIIGIARLVDVIAPCETVHDCSPVGYDNWHMHSQYGFLLKDIRPLPFTPCAGQLNFFHAPEAVLAHLGLNAQIAGP